MVYYYLYLIIAAVISTGIIIFYIQSKKPQKINAVILLLAPAMTFGIILYFIGYYPPLIGQPLESGQTGFGAVVNGFLHAVASAMSMLVGRDDYATIEHNGQHFTTLEYMIPFWITHLFAGVVTIMAAVTVFSKNILTKLRLIRYRSVETYIIFGVNDRSLCFAQNIMTSKGTKRDYPLRFVVFIDETADEGEKEKIGKMGAVIINDSMFYKKEINGSTLQKAGFYRNANTLHVFAFTDSEILNYVIAKSIWKVGIEKSISKNRLKGIYVYTNLAVIVNDLEMMRQNFEEKYQYDLKYFCEEDLAARQLFEFLPLYKKLKFNLDTGLPFQPSDSEYPLLSKAFGATQPCLTIIILGFGSTGSHILRQAVSNGQFEGCIFKVAVFDKRSDDFKGTFIKKYPALFDKTIPKDIEIDFFNDSIGSVLFYNELDQIIGENGRIDYIVSCLGDDDMNFETISDIRRYLIRKKVKKDDMPIMTAHIVDKNYQMFDVEDEHIAKIYFFGDYEEIFTHQVIVNEEMDVLAMSVNSVAYGNNDWSGMSLHNKNSNRSAAAQIEAYLHMMGFEKAGKTILDKLDTKDYELVTKLQYEKFLEANPVLVNNLGKTEHLRWNAFHFASGWERKPLDEVSNFESRKDYYYKTHACLVSWDELSIVKEYIIEKAITAGLTGKALTDLEEKCAFQDIDKDIIRNIAMILDMYNSNVGQDEKKLYIIRMVKHE